MDWLATELLTGLQKLLSLGLDRTPASDVIEVTVGAWYEAITTGRRFEQDRDTPRVRAAFVTLAQTVDRWPQPKHFLDALPRPEQPPAIAYEAKPLTPEQAEARMAELRRLLAEASPLKPMPSPTQADRGTSPEVKAQLEAEAAARYANCGKSAAAGPDQ